MDQAAPHLDIPSTAPALDVDTESLRRELDQLRDWLESTAGPEDLRHLRKIELIGRAASLIGYATAWIAPNPLSIFGMSLGRFMRWTCVGHHVVHKGYERVEGTPKSRFGAVFARGWRRAIDWFDWIDPAAWHEEHNIQHHYRLNEEADPDLVERNLSWMRESKLPRWLRWALLPLMMASWKFVYYGPSTLEVLAYQEARRAGETARSMDEELHERWTGRGLSSFLPKLFNPRIWKRSWGPYLLTFFVIVPLLFLPLGRWAVLSVLINTLLAEIVTNVHAFIAIVPNHAGSDLYRFEDRTKGRHEFYLRQIIGSTNYRTGGDFVDLMHGWLNYQIEHHLWPDLSMLQYRRAQPRVQEICERHGVPYVQESVWKRVYKAAQVMVGDASMLRYPAARDGA